jgi:3-oxoacyl-[acyl-carrier-protein] synthase-3
VTTALGGTAVARRRTTAAPAVPVVVAGTGAYLPERRLTNADLEHEMDTSDAWIVERTGIRERRIAAPDEATASMATRAARAALADAGLDPADIDLCLIATCTPDQVLPSTASFVTDALGVRCAAFDLVAACSGFVYGLVTASSMVAAGVGQTALVVGAETLSRYVDFSDRSTGMLFGDGAGAVILAPSGASRGRARATVDLRSSGPGDGDGAGGPGLLGWDLGCDGSATGILEYKGGGSRFPTSAETMASGLHAIRMDGREVYRRAVRAVVDSVSTTLERSGISADDVDLFIPHQANARIVDAVLPRLGIPAERTVMNIDRYGNTSAASIPIALAEAAASGRLRANDVVLMTGFGAGMTWASAALRWGRAAGPAPA